MSINKTYDIHIYDALGFPRAKTNRFSLDDIIFQYREDLKNHGLDVENLTDDKILISILSAIRNSINETVDFQLGVK